jgi:phage-related protein
MLLTSKQERPARPLLKPLKWVGGSRRSLSRCPEDVKDVLGAALLDIQFGDTPAGAKPFGEGLPREIWKFVENSEGNTYRAAYTVAFPEVVYVLDVFMKKSKSGIGTPRMIKDRVRERFNAAKRDYDEHHRATGER